MEKTDFKEAVSRSLVLIDFWAPWCEPCKMLDEILEELKSRMPELFIHKVNVDDHVELANEHFIRSVPVLILYKNAVEVWRMNGFKLATELEETIRKFQ
ncbi:MAG: thiol reductase thioredoxin [Bacteroidia bacterium]|nr:thiol reductase thioredoxin [Bacteroidia bacterium]